MSSSDNVGMYNSNKGQSGPQVSVNSEPRGEETGMGPTLADGLAKPVASKPSPAPACLGWSRRMAEGGDADNSPINYSPPRPPSSSSSTGGGPVASKRRVERWLLHSNNEFPVPQMGADTVMEGHDETNSVANSSSNGTLTVEGVAGGPIQQQQQQFWITFPSSIQQPTVNVGCTISSNNYFSVLQ